jgi:hypothetical protein
VAGRAVEVGADRRHVESGIRGAWHRRSRRLPPGLGRP